MGSVPTVNPGVADLLQTLNNLKSPVLSSKAAVNALDSASTADIVQLSAAANQLQNIDAIFGVSSTPSTDMSSVLAALGSSAGNSSGSDASSTLSGSPADQLATAMVALQGELTQGLFGTGTSSSQTGTILNALG